jgi:hypothetical protein
MQNKEHLCISLPTSVACCCWPMWYHIILNWFFLPKPGFLELIWIFSGRNPTNSESKSYQINPIKSCSSRSFQQHQRHIPIPPKCLVTNLIFSEKIIQYSRTSTPTTSPNAMKPSPDVMVLPYILYWREKNDNKIGVGQFKHSYQHYTLPFTIVLSYFIGQCFFFPPKW